MPVPSTAPAAGRAGGPARRPSSPWSTAGRARGPRSTRRLPASASRRRQRVGEGQPHAHSAALASRGLGSPGPHPTTAGDPPPRRTRVDRRVLNVHDSVLVAKGFRAPAPLLNLASQSGIGSTGCPPVPPEVATDAHTAYECNMINAEGRGSPASAPLRNEKVRGSNPLSSTLETVSDMRKRSSGPVSRFRGRILTVYPCTPRVSLHACNWCNEVALGWREIPARINNDS